MTFLHHIFRFPVAVFCIWCLIAVTVESLSTDPDTDLSPDISGGATFGTHDDVDTNINEPFQAGGMEKRDTDNVLRQKFGQNYKWIGLGKRGPEGGARQKFGKNYKFIGLGKRDQRIAKVNPSYKYIGLGKRMAPLWSSHLLTNFKDIFGENEKPTTGVSRGRFMRPVYSVVTKKVTPAATGNYNDAGTIFSDEDMSAIRPEVFANQGRPNARGGAFEPPIFVGRYVGLG